MAMLPCDICGKFGHPWFDCGDRGAKPVGWKPERLTSSRKATSEEASGVAPVPVLPAGPIKLDGGERPAKPGRPKVHPDRKAYKAEAERKRRAAAREAKK